MKLPITNCKLPISLLLGIVLTFMPGCGKKPIAGPPPPLPPGALSQADAQSYDFLMTLKGAIDGFKSQYAALPLDWKYQIQGPLNQAIKDYNLAEAAWQLQHATRTGDLSGTNLAINQLMQDIALLQQAFNKKATPTPTP